MGTTTNEPSVTLDDLIHHIDELIDHIDSSGYTDNSEVVELLTETNGYIDTEIADLLDVSNQILTYLQYLFIIACICIAWKLVNLVFSLVNSA